MPLHVNSGPDVFQRNLGSQATSSTVSPTGTSTIFAASTDGGSSGALTPGGSPPLIVAFLAIGLLMAAMIAVFGWRRMTYGRGIGVHLGRGGGVGPLKSLEEFGEKPILWDLWTQRPVGHHDDELKWDGIMPLSASIKKQLEDEETHDGTHSRIPAQHDNIRQHFRNPTRVRKTAAGNSKTEAPTLQVAIAIAMPSSRKREHEWTHEGTSSTDDTSNHIHKPCDDDDNMLGYSLGLMDIPWHSKEG